MSEAKAAAEAAARTFSKAQVAPVKTLGSIRRAAATPATARAMATETRALAKVFPQEARAVAKELREDAKHMSSIQARRKRQAPPARVVAAPPPTAVVARAAAKNPIPAIDIERFFGGKVTIPKAAKPKVSIPGGDLGTGPEPPSEDFSRPKKAKKPEKPKIVIPGGDLGTGPEPPSLDFDRPKKPKKEPKAEAPFSSSSSSAAGGAGGPPEEPAAAEPESKLSINPKILALKVGDYIGYSVAGGYMGDGGDSRDSAGYNVSFKITKIEGEKYHVTGGRYGHNSDFVVAIKKPSMGGSASSWGNSLHLVSGKAYGDRKDFTPNNYTMKDESFGENEYNYAKARELLSKREGAKAAKKAEDWTKSTKYELVSMIDKHFEAQGKQMRGHKTAGKDKLIEIIRKYKIAE